MKVNLKYQTQMHFVASARQFEEIHIDEPESFHGSDLGPSAVEYFLIGTGGCIGSTFVYCLHKNNVLIDNLEIIINGTLKHEGPEKRLRLLKIDVEILVSLKDNSVNDNYDLCVKKFQEHCPISNLLTQGIPLNINISKK
jgi:uncharacterized OsmC-like protein